MTRTVCLWFAASALAWPLAAQTSRPAAAPFDLPDATHPGPAQAYSVIERGPHHRVMASVTWTTNAVTGRRLARTNSYTELRVGMHRLEDGHWVEASAEIELVPGGAVARKGAHQVSFAGNLNVRGAIDCTTPDAKRLRATVLGLSYLDTATGQSVLIAELKDSIGELLPTTNQVLYPDAFTQLRADVLYTYTRAGLQQDIILREQPPSPAEFGLDPGTTRLDVLTEFLDPPQPAIASVAAAPGASDAALPDETLGFGAMGFRRGKAFTIGGLSNSPARIPVSKSWQQIGGRTFLVEGVAYRQVEPQVQTLPAPSFPRQAGGTGPGALLRVSPHRLLPDLKLAAPSTNTMLLASSSALGTGFVLDYDLSGSLSNFTFQGDTTYLISDTVVASGATTIEGGAVIKYLQYPDYTETSQLVLDGTLNCTASPYHMAVLTSMDDNSVGEHINGSSGNPSPNVWCESAYLCAGNVQLSNLRFAYAYYGLSAGDSGETQISNCQFVHCGGCGIYCVSGYEAYEPSIVLRNVLFSGGWAVWFMDTEGFSVTAENVTAAAGAFVYGDNSSGAVFVTNSILTGIVKAGSANITAATNSVVVNAAATVFQTVGAGGWYLAANSPYRNVGTTNSSPSLLAELRQRTTYPPIVYSNVLISADTTLGPQVQRDTDTPDLGYHYDPIDYACRATSLSNAVLQLQPGTALATFGTSYGLGVTIGSALVSEGTPTTPNHIVRYNLVQEGANTNWNGRSGSVLGDWRGGAAPAQVRCRFTDWSTPAQDTCHYQDYYEQTLKQFVDCQFHGGFLFVTVPSYNMTNCLLERVSLMLDDNVGAVNVSPVVRNCLFYGGTLALGHYSLDTWLFRDNSFDQTQLSLDVGGSDIDSAYNAYLTNYGRLMPVSATDVIVTNFNWQTGWLGNYYLPTNSPLINAGSVTAHLAGLYHYTTQTNQVKETNSVVDIGYHHVAVDANGTPADSDGDGIADYLEDANGNGQSDSGETQWSLAIHSPPQSQTVMEGSVVTLNVVASGLAPLAYQWSLNGQDIPGATSSGLTTEELDLAASGRVYAVRILNAAGAVASAEATLEVIPCDPVARPLAVSAWKTNCEDGFYFAVTNLSGSPLTGGRFDLFVFYAGASRSLYRNLQPWAQTDVLPNGASHLFTFCSPDHAITNFDCAIFYRGGGTCAASPRFRIASRDSLTLVMANTTQIANPCLECESCEEGAPAAVAPRSRPEERWQSGVYHCQPDPCGLWPQPLPALSSEGSAAQRLDNFYMPTASPEYVDLACPKTGFKNVYAIKQWHGIWGPKSPMRGRFAEMCPVGSCLTPPSPQNAPDTTKYVTLSATASVTVDGTYDVNSLPIETGTWTASSTCTVNTNTGRITGSAVHPDGSWGPTVAAFMGGASTLSISSLAGVYLNSFAFEEWFLPYVTWSGCGSTVSVSWDYEYEDPAMPGVQLGVKGQSEVDLVAGTFHIWWEDKPGPVTWYHYDEQISIGETSVVWTQSYNTHWSDENWETTTLSATATYSDPYTSADVNHDCDVLLAQWNLLDDLQYPWRNDGGITRGPLVTYNEGSAAAPMVLHPGFADTNAPPWPSQPPGAILGAPLPVHGPGGEQYAYQPYFNFYHINWGFAESERGHPYGFIASRGAFSPYPNATQWVDDDQARCFPGGPFWAYGSEVENWNHAMFRLKNPCITDNNGEWEQGGYGGSCLVKCKWAETLASPAPPGSDFVFKDWTFNFRDFFESYGWCAGAWFRSNYETTCPGLSNGTPARFTPAVIPPDQPGAGYYIGPGSYWISEMNCSPLHYDYDCCRPVVFVQPGPPPAGCGNGIFFPMPPAVCDGQYGSLWMGRVDQSTNDAHACDNYVANRNNGLPNPPACEPQIELDLIWHSRAQAYETFVAPLGFTPGDGPRRLILDLDLDSDNNNGFDPPARNDLEDLMEDAIGSPGKIIAANDGDSDEDGIPGFADGFSWGFDGSDVSNDGFVPLVLQIPSDVNIAECKLRLSYSASAPATVTYGGTPPAWETPTNGNLRIWLKDGNQPRNRTSANDPAYPGDYVEPGMYSDLARLGFSAGTRTVTAYVEGIRPSAVGALEITAVLYADGTPPRSTGRDAVRVTVARVNLDIARKNGEVVPRDQKQSNGSLVQIVPETNPGSLYPDGIFLNIPSLAIEPPALADLVTLKLKKVGPSSSQGKIRVYRQPAGQQPYSVFLDADQTEQTVTSADLSSAWRLDSTQGGVVDLALVAEIPAGTEFGRSTVRISSIPVEPADGRIIFVNPASTSPQWPYASFVRNAAQDVYTAVMSMQLGDNVLIAQATYVENSIPVFSSGVIAGLGGAWSDTNPAQTATPLADAFDYSTLPILDGSGEPETLFDSASIFTGPATYGGLAFQNGTYNEMSSDRSGGAIYVSNSGSPVRIGFCDFQSNTAFDYGGAIYLSLAPDVQINASRFEGNKAQYTAQGDAVCDRGMGGAIASIESFLTVSNSIFSGNSALVVATGGSAPSLGSAGGGGDVYVKKGTFGLFNSSSSGAVAGFPLPFADPSPEGQNTPEYFTGDGGSILIHCPDPGVVLEIRDSTFANSRSYGNGGAICVSYDSSTEGRSGFNTSLVDLRPVPLGGICSGVASNVLFTGCHGGWQGGAVSGNGRGLHLALKQCTFLGCEAGTAHKRDGKGGAIATFGGLKYPYPLFNDFGTVTADACLVVDCTATGNGGGLYNTVRGLLQVQNGTAVRGCTAQNAAQGNPSGRDWSQTEGLGGGIYCSAGGRVVLSGGCLVKTNNAISCGGGLGVKSARAELNDTVTIQGNRALGSATNSWGNGGGVYVASSCWNEAEPAATLFQDEGTLVCSSSGVSIAGNTASRWGGGLYAGLCYYPARVGCRVVLDNATVSSNTAGASILFEGSSLLPSQIAVERVGLNLISPTIEFMSCTVAGTNPAADIGIYLNTSIAAAGTPNYVPGTLAQNQVAQ